MTTSEFKVGDLVYYPLRGTRIFQLKYSNSQAYPVSIFYYLDDDDHYDTFTRGGLGYVDHTAPVIFHATEENHKLLEQLYGMKFEEPPVKPTSKDIIKALLDRGDKYVPCWVSDYNQEPNEQNRVELIYKYDEYSKYPYSCEDNSWVYATPFDIRTGKALVDISDV